MGLLKTLTINGTKYEVVPVVPATSVTLLASAWEASGDVYSQVVGVPGATPHTKVDLQPTTEQLCEFHNKVLSFVTENDGGTVTVFAIGDKPTGDYTIQITLTEVEASGKIRSDTVGTPMPRANLDQTDPEQADYVKGRDKLVWFVNGVAQDAGGNVVGSIVCTASGTSIAVNDASDGLPQGMRIFGKTTQNGTPTPDAPIPLMIAGANGSITLSVEQTGQSMVFNTPNGLPGIKMQPTCEKYNFVDADGNKWLCDEIDLNRGVYVQWCDSVVLDGTENFGLPPSGIYYIDPTIVAKLAKLDHDSTNKQCYHICSHFLSVPRSKNATNLTVNSYGGAYGPVLAFRWNENSGNIDAWKAYLAEQYAAGTPLTVVFGMKNAVETALSQETIESYKTLRTAKGETTIITDGPAFMEVSYVADTKLYIDNKFNALASAIVNNT